MFSVLDKIQFYIVYTHQSVHIENFGLQIQQSCSNKPLFQYSSGILYLFSLFEFLCLNFHLSIFFFVAT
jgi:hypothetical protein